MPDISIIVLTFNEEKYIVNCIDSLQSIEGIESAEIIVADGNSMDNTVLLLDESIVLVRSEPNRSVQMNAALAVAKGNVIWFVHADMLFPPDALVQIRKLMDAGFDGGGFHNIFDRHNSKIRTLGKLMNLRIFDRREQSDKGIFYGDNAIFVRRDVINKIGGVPQQEIMEDYELSIRLRQKGARLTKIRQSSIVVSSRRHEQEGFVSTRLKWIFIRIMYKLGFSTHMLSRFYQVVR